MLADQAGADEAEQVEPGGPPLRHRAVKLEVGDEAAVSHPLVDRIGAHPIRTAQGEFLRAVQIRVRPLTAEAPAQEKITGNGLIAPQVEGKLGEAAIRPGRYGIQRRVVGQPRQVERTDRDHDLVGGQPPAAPAVGAVAGHAEARLVHPLAVGCSAQQVVVVAAMLIGQPRVQRLVRAADQGVGEIRALGQGHALAVGVLEGAAQPVAERAGHHPGPPAVRPQGNAPPCLTVVDARRSKGQTGDLVAIPGQIVERHRGVAPVQPRRAGARVVGTGTRGEESRVLDVQRKVAGARSGSGLERAVHHDAG